MKRNNMRIDDGSKMIRKAIKFAEMKHTGQVRKISGSPYVHHPLMVSYVAANFKKSKNLYKIITAAILHDVIEDTDTTPEEITKEFGMLISSLVFELSDDPEEIQKIGKFEYQKAKWPGLSNYGLFLKLCDRYCNLLDGAGDKYLCETSIIIKNLKKKRILTGSQRNILREIEKLTRAYAKQRKENAQSAQEAACSTQPREEETQQTA